MDGITWSEDGRHLVSNCGEYYIFNDEPLGFDPKHKGKPLAYFGVSLGSAKAMCAFHKAGELKIENFKPLWLIEREMEAMQRKEIAVEKSETKPSPFMRAIRFLLTSKGVR